MYWYFVNKKKSFYADGEMETLWCDKIKQSEFQLSALKIVWNIPILAHLAEAYAMVIYKPETCPYQYWEQHL